MGRIKVLVVDDSVVVRRIVTTVLDADPDIDVVGVAANGKIALSKLSQVAPDLVTLDIEMPEMDGLATLRELRTTHPRLPVIMFSTLTERGATATFDALQLGANDYVTKPANVGSVPEAMEAVRAQLIPKIRALCPPARASLPRAVAAPRTPLGATSAAAAPTARVEVLAIGSSTGGPDALTVLLPALPADLPVPVVIVQHMPPVFTRLFAQRLDGKCGLTVKEAEDGDVVEPGRVLIAPGGRHMVLRRDRNGVRVVLNDGPPESFCRPAVDVLFRSVAETYGDKVLAAVLTGMGSDGARGAEVLRRAGAEVIAQDEATSVVWGMPGALAAAGLAHRLLPLPKVAGDIRDVVARGRSAALAGERA